MSQMQNHFRFIANNLSLDFLNTVVMRDGKRCEMLETPDDLKNWFSSAEMNVSGSIDINVLDKAISLRTAVKNSIKALHNNQPLDQRSIDLINAALAHRIQSASLKLTEHSLLLDTDIPARDPLNALAEIAFYAAEILTSDKLDKVKSCSNEKCILIFHDTSKSGRRRWCSMDTCGNRAKVSKHYHTHKE